MRLIAEVTLDGELVPWSPPRSFLGGKPGKARWHVHKKDERLCSFQDQVRAACRAVYQDEPYRGPVMLCLLFTRRTPDESLWGQRWWHEGPKRGHGDLTNYTKAVEDAVKTYRQWKGKGKARVMVKEEFGIIEEDSQVSDGFQRKRWGPRDGLLIRVYAIEEENRHDPD